LEDIDFLTSYLIEKYAVDIIFDKEEVDAYYYDANCISICTSHSKEIQLFCLLHEAGHLIIRKRKSFSRKYPEVSSKKRLISNSIDTIREEIDAWKEGERLANKLSINLDKKKWNKYASSQIFKYIEWAYERKHK